MITNPANPVSALFFPISLCGYAVDALCVLCVCPFCGCSVDALWMPCGCSLDAQWMLCGMLCGCSEDALWMLCGCFVDVNTIGTKLRSQVNLFMPFS